jgi:hypothetical protein
MKPQVDLIAAYTSGCVVDAHHRFAMGYVGFDFVHKESCYFAVSAIGRDQVESYAARKGMTVAEVERWLSPVPGYDPSRV